MADPKSRVWLVQNALFNDEVGHAAFLAALSKYAQTVIPIDYVFWRHTIDLKVSGHSRYQIVPIGSMEFIEYGLQQDWYIFHGFDKFNYMFTALSYGSEMLNYDAEYGIATDLHLPQHGLTWIRSNEGFNRIKGSVIHNQEWSNICEDHRIKGHFGGGIGSYLVWASPKEILAEYRCFIVNGKPVTSSQYRKDGVVDYQNTDNYAELMCYAQKMADLWSPCPTFVLDIAKNRFGDFKVLETNCFNCSGHYAADPEKIVRAIVGEKSCSSTSFS
jgi:hypothetical protein